MIKKIMAMLVAISCAFGAWADTHINGTDFSGLATGPFTVGLDDGGQTGTTYWYNGATNDFDGTIVVEGGKNFLTFESSITNPLYRTFKSCNGASSTSTLNPTNIGDGLFIDTTVQFTPYLVNESHDAPSKLSAEDKLIVWVCETESTNNVPNTTNLIVTAGYLGSGGSTIVSNYVVTTIGENELDSATVSGLCSHTNRLTIKAFETITTEDATVAGFVVYLNEMPLGYAGDAIATGSLFYDKLKPTPGYWYGNRQLFPSLMSYDASENPGQLSGVGYAGMGKIGDVFLDDYSTDYPEFAGDGHNFTVVLGDGVTSFMYNNVVYSNNYASSVELAVDSVTISNVTYDADHGWKHKDDTWRNENDTVVNNRVDASGKDYGTFYFADGAIFTLIGFQANYIVNGAEFDNLTDALAAALAGGYTLVLNNDVEITEGDGSLTIGENKTLVLDLKGHTIKGTGGSETPTIMNMGGTLTIIDTSANHDGKVLNNDDANLCLASFTGSTTTLDAGIYEDIDDLTADATTITINGGTYKDALYDGTPEYEFYLIQYGCLASGKEVIDWIQISGDNYAVIGEGGPTGYFPQSPIEEEWADRKGTAAKPFVIRNAADFAGLKRDIEDGYNLDKYFEVVSNNIELTEWVGIGSETGTKFAGNLNGGGKTVNVTFAAGAKYNGLFCAVTNATIANLTVNVTAGSVSGSTGGAAIIGKAYGSCTFEALKATGSLGTSVTPVSHNAAGICCSLDGATTGNMYFNYCTNAMAIYAGYTKVGGILAFNNGWMGNIHFNYCVNLGNISNISTETGIDRGTGGLMGWSGQYGTITINGFTNAGTITANIRPANVIADVHIIPTVTGVNTGLASIKSCDATNAKTIPGLDWATVDGDVATFVTPVTTVESAVAYKYMREQKAGEVTGFTLAAAAASLTIDTSLAAYTGTVSVDSTLSADYDLRETAILNGTIYSLVSKTPADPWAPTEQTDAAASNKVVSIFGEGSDVANHVTTLAEYNALVAYITNVTSEATVPSDLSNAQKAWMWKSFILGANPLFDADVAVEITSLTANSEAGKWDFTVKVTEGESTDAYNVAADKVAALVKIRTSLTTGTWVTPTAGNIEAIKLLGGNLIKVTVNFGDGTSGFMKVSEE